MLYRNIKIFLLIVSSLYFLSGCNAQISNRTDELSFCDTCFNLQDIDKYEASIGSKRLNCQEKSNTEMLEFI